MRDEKRELIGRKA